MGPLSPPATNSETKPSANSIGVVNLGRDRHTVASQLKTLAAEGMAMARDAALNTVPANGFRPATNMWCPQTTMPSRPISTVVAIMSR